ncbi:hypothetical protein Q068_00006 [Pseudomonas aeruginosa BL14]|nr:hypothetical protein Q068_06534 [Pseudomonas aeruginosa BL14]ERV23324.1 hypothetical protein Q068_06470 [Pseudomonas aeruginosa BL14]ERV24076.1 hypothetical protein Q068_06356 [Pseudomonas aeruginosa BL14]ERV49440.1 hypothetical protein Q068_00006 [Pseudomonas aeruginosa BL14]
MCKKLDLLSGLLEYFKFSIYACFLKFAGMLVATQ